MNGEREGIARCIEQVNSCSDELARLRSSTDECMAGLNRQWNDESAARFYAMYDEISSRMYTLMLKMTEYGEFLGTLSDSKPL